MSVSSAARWLRLITVLSILLQLLLVPAAQAQEEGGLVQEVESGVSLAATPHATVSAGCSGGSVDFDGSSWSPSTAHVHIYVDVDDASHRLFDHDVTRGTATQNYTWSNYAWLNTCTPHTLYAKFTCSGCSTYSDGFGGASCCLSVDAGCTAGRVTTSGGVPGELVVTVDGTTEIFRGDVGDATQTFDWDALNVNACASHTLNAAYRSSSASDDFGGSSCCDLDVDADCTQGTVNPGGSAHGVLLVVTLDGTRELYRGEVDHDDATLSFNWSSLGVDRCSSHTLQGDWGGIVDTDTFGGTGREFSYCCHHALSANCAGISVQCYAYVGDWLTVAVDGDTIYNFIVLGGNPNTLNLPWSDYGIDPCGTHNVVATFRGVTKSITFNGATQCQCGCQQTTDWQTVETGAWQYDPATGQVCRTLRQVKYDLNDPTHVCEERTIPDCSYVACTNVTGVWETTGYGPWYWDAGRSAVCRDQYQVRYDAYLPGRVCSNQTIQDCSYQACSQTTGVWETTGYGAWHWDAQKGQVCRERYQVMYDAYAPGQVCDEQTVDDCQYEECSDPTGVWETTGYGAWHWDAEKQQVCRDEYQVMYDEYVPGKVCDEQTIADCSYGLCTETTDESCSMIQDWTWDAEEQDFYQLWVCKRFDKYDTQHECSSRQETRWQNYQECSQTVLGGEISRRGPEYKNGQLCWWVTYAVLDANTGAQCGTTELERCETYQTCSATRHGRELSREGPFYDHGTMCYSVTYELLDLYTGEVCGQETVKECQGVGNGCNSPRLNPTSVRQGQTVTVRFSAYGMGITRIECYLLGDARDGARAGGGGAWYLIGSSGSDGGSASIDTSALYPKQRTVWVRAYYPGGWSDCYGHFTVTPGPTPTLPAPGFVPCPSCVEDIVYQSNKEGQWDIYSASATGRDERRLTTSPADDTAPAWYPAGQYVAFQTDRDGNSEVYTMDADGANQVNLTNHPAEDVAPFWSCKYVYFQSNRDGNWEIYRICADGSGELRLTDNAATDAQPAASCDELVVFQSNRDGNWEIYIMNADGTGVRRLTNTSWAEMSPQFSPNGQWIVYQTKKTGNWEISVMDLNGQNVRPIVLTASPDQSPAWHPYCDWVYFQSLRLGSWDIYRTNQDGTVTQRVTTRASSAEMIDDQVDY